MMRTDFSWLLQEVLSPQEQTTSWYKVLDSTTTIGLPPLLWAHAPIASILLPPILERGLLGSEILLLIALSLRFATINILGELSITTRMVPSLAKVLVLGQLPTTLITTRPVASITPLTMEVSSATIVSKLEDLRFMMVSLLIYCTVWL